MFFLIISVSIILFLLHILNIACWPILISVKVVKFFISSFMIPGYFRELDSALCFYIKFPSPIILFCLLATLPHLLIFLILVCFLIISYLFLLFPFLYLLYRGLFFLFAIKARHYFFPSFLFPTIFTAILSLKFIIWFVELVIHSSFTLMFDGKIEIHPPILIMTETDLLWRASQQVFLTSFWNFVFSRHQFLLSKWLPPSFHPIFSCILIFPSLIPAFLT